MARRRVMWWLLTMIGVCWGLAAPAAAETLCDPSFQDCRSVLINYIRNENVRIDVAFWFMEDSRYSTEIIKRWQAGVPVRVIIDQRALPAFGGAHPDEVAILQSLVSAGIPIRQRALSDPGILHWKMMLFAGQGVVEFDGANYSPYAFIYQSPYSNYEEESIYFADDPAIVNSFMTEYDNFWVDTTLYADYANITPPLARIYPIYAKDPDLNFPQQEDYALRILKRYAAEKQKIDVIMFRITDERHTNAMIAALQRGIPVRIISEWDEYRLASRLWVAYNMDKLWAAGVPLRVRAHEGLNHQKLVILYGQQMSVFGSSNWTSPSANAQQEHNYFTTKPWIFQWFVDQFERKWNNLAPNGAIETQPFTPLPPDKPLYLSPAAGAIGTARSMELQWNGGPWSHVYDVYFGTDPNPPLFAANLPLGPTDPSAPVTQKLVLPLLQPGTTYYWCITDKTIAGLSKTGAVSSFTTAGSAPPPAPAPAGSNTIVMWTDTDVAPGSVVGAWQWTNDSTAAGGRALWNPDHNSGKVSPPLAAPASYFETTFNAMGGVAYHLWVRLRAQANSTSNNAVSVQFDDALDQFGSRLYRIGSPSGAEVILTDPSGTLNGWGWADAGSVSPATPIYFSSTGPHTIRVQPRNDGAIVDQIILSPDAFLSSAPGVTLNDTTIYGSTLDGAAPPQAPPSSPPPQPPVPVPWQQQDIGTVGLPGYGNFDGPSSTFSVVAAGADVWGNADAFHFVYQPLNGDGSIVARVATLQNTNVWSKAGVMIRETLTPGSTNAFMLVSSAKGLAFQGRPAAGGATTTIAGRTKAAPYWVRLDRAGNTFTAYQSADGVTWATVGSYTIAMGSSAFIGLAVSSHNVDATATATFDQATVNGAATCAYAVSPASQSLNGGGDTATITLTTGSACSWTATSGDTSWLTVTSAASGTGAATITLSAAANSGAPRTTTVTIGGQTFTASQAAASCSYAVSPASQTMAAGGDSATLSVSTGSWCTWTVTTSDPTWLTVTSGGSGTGNGTIALSAAGNGGGPRTATVSVGGQTFTASQAAASCSYAISPATASMAAGGDTASVAVTATGAWCTWTAASGASWLTITGGASGAGSGPVSLSASMNSGAARTGTVTIAGQTFTASQAAAPPPSTTWSNQDIGAVGAAGTTSFNSGTGVVSVTGAGADVWGTADAFQYAYQPLWGDGSIVARVAAVQNINAWTKAGVMIRETLDPGSAQGFMLVSFGKGSTFQRRTATNGVSTSTAAGSVTAPYWVRLDRVGNALSAYQSADGVTWTFVDSDTIPMAASVFIGLGVSSHTTTTAATGTFDHVTITAGTPVSPTPLPATWANQDIGSVGAAGAAAFNAGSNTFVVKGAGADIWGTADAFQYAYTPMTGDGVVVARVATIQNTSGWAKAGVMIRETLDPKAAQAIMLASYSRGLAFQRRVSAGGASTTTSGALVAAPYWVKLERIGNTFNAYSSADGVSWALVGSDSIPMSASVYVGLAVSSHLTTAAAQATFDNVSTP